MAASFEALDKWHKTRNGYLTFGLVELAMAYAFGSLALNSARTWQYLLAIIFLIGGIRNLVQLFRVPKT